MYNAWTDLDISTPRLYQNRGGNTKEVNSRVDSGNGKEEVDHTKAHGGS
jgi:hypothetical protein